MNTPQHSLKELKESSLFREWQNQHQSSFLSHFFSQINNVLEGKSGWEIGFYIPEHNKITVFLESKENFQIKPEDDVFKKDESKVEELSLDEIKINYEEASKTFNENVNKLFPNEQLGDGFIVLVSNHLKI